IVRPRGRPDNRPARKGGAGLLEVVGVELGEPAQLVLVDAVLDSGSGAARKVLALDAVALGLVTWLLAHGVPPHLPHPLPAAAPVKPARPPPSAPVRPRSARGRG